MWRKNKKPSSPQPFFLPSEPTTYPAGTVVSTNKGRFLINRDGKRYRISSERIFASWNFPLVVETSEIALKHYPVAITKLGFRDGSLLNNIKDGKMYLVSDSRLRHITSPDVLVRLNVTAGNFLLVSDDEINLMKQGEEIS